MAVISTHDHFSDWCHVCGQRSDHNADCFYPAKAESASLEQHRAGFWSNPPANYVRVCLECAKALVEVAEAETKISVTREPKRRKKC
jgi:hypothetical protein